MLSLMLLTANVRERQILHLAFEQHQIKVIEAEPDHASYIKALQYSPDIVVMEFPSYYTEQLHFSKNISNSLTKKKKVLIIGYGHKMVPAEERALSTNGVKHYLNRPLKFSLVMKHLEKHLGVFAPEKIVWKNKKKDSKADEEDYVEILFNIDILPTKKIDILSEKITALMAFPFTVMKVLQLTEDSKSGASDLGKVILADPVISASILKLANTVFYASRNRRISTIKDAIIRIGFTETKHLTMAMSVMNSLSSDTDNIGFNRLEFWYHSLSVAVVAEKLSKNIPTLNSSEMFLTGLLHSFGIVLLDEFFPDLFEQLLIKTTDRGGAFLQTERDLMIVTHNDLTFKLFEEWKIPPQISAGIKFSEEVSSIIDKEPGNITSDEMSGLVLNIADQLVKTLSLGNECDVVVTHINKALFELISLRNGITQNFIDSFLHEIAVFRKFLKLEELDEDVTLSGTGHSILMIAPPLPFFTPAEFYFQQLGFTITRFSESEDHSEYDEKFDFTLFWYENQPNETEISAIQKIRDINRYPITSIVVSGASLEKEAEKRYNFENRMDLRFLNVTAQKIIESKGVE